jgi:uncharacterized damage-inducible protein DinB
MSLLLRMGQYMLWADKKIWNIAKTLSDDDFSRDLDDNGGSIRGRYLHMAEGHSQWYNRWNNVSSEQIRLEELDRGDLFRFLQRYNELILDSNHGNGFDVAEVPILDGRILLPVEEMVFNIINHATYHRGQIVTLLRRLGKSVSPTDYVPYLLEKNNTV